MNNFQHTPTKFFYPANNVAEYCEIYDRNIQEEKQRAKNWEKTNRNRVFKLCQESEVNNSASPLAFCSVEDDKKSRKVSRRAGHKPEDGSPQKPSYFSIIDSQLTKAKAVGRIKPHNYPRIHYLKDLLDNDQSAVRDVSQKQLGRTESIKAPLNTLVRKASTEGWKKLKVVEKSKPSVSSTEKAPSVKTFEKGSKGESSGTSADLEQKRINEILKSHAQKIQNASAKSSSAKVYCFSAVSDLLKKAQNVSGTIFSSEVAEEKKSVAKVEVKPEEVKSKTSDKGSKEIGKHNEDNEERKKIPSQWMKVPQSNELERRLKGNWEDQAMFYVNEKNAQREASVEEENKIPKKQETTQQEDKKTKKPESAKLEEEKKPADRRTTYTDRLLLLKIIGKEMEEKKAAAAANAPQEKEPEPKTPSIKERQENLKKTDGVPLNRALEFKVSAVIARTPQQYTQQFTQQLPVQETTAKVVSPSENKEQPADNPPPEPEHVIKAKQTRSAELRDIVNQAIKEHKIFSIFDNHSYIVKPVREELMARGWLEVVPDRRLIPRRRPPPMGPIFERDKSVTDRNCNTLEAILTAKETFADELQETVSKTTSFKWAIEKPKPERTCHTPPTKKSSDDSLNETCSEFRIIPPTTDRKKNNIEIREFTAKYNAILAKEFDREKAIRRLREKEKNAKALRKEKNKSAAANADKQKPRSKRKGNEPDEIEHIILPGSKSFEDILHSIRENKRTIVQAASDIRHMEDKNLSSRPELGVLFEAAANGAKELLVEQPPKTQDKMVGTSPPEKIVCVNGKALFTESEIRTMSKIIQANNARIHFMWLSIKPAIHLKCFNYSPEIVNKFQRTTFCTKIGLWSHLNNIQWYAHEVHYPAKSPRMYNTGEADDLQAFFEDFQMTACIGLLKWLSDTFYERGLKAVQAKKGKVPLKAFEFAIKQCEKYIRFKENEDLSVLDESKVHSDEWNTFLQWFYIITNDHGKVQESSSGQLMVVYTKAVETLKLIRRHWPEMDIDGRLNIWIMKPYCASCGRGIFMTNNVYYIGQHTKYIVQKYIEKPLLIYNTKFDIRQWFMITRLTPLEIWMYKECYLRFCTQPFALRNLHESVHLSNNSVQRKYVSYRDPSLPDQNMWDSKTFQLYLKTIGQPTTWEDVIYPGMKDAIVSTMLASQDTFDGPRKSWFEVYGADFMLSANLKEGPWLIEINENPAMDPSTKVTARLCPQMLRDVIKVIVDKRTNKNANTGQWELIYRQNYSPSFGTVDLDIKGKKIARMPHCRNISNLPKPMVSSPVYMRRNNSNDVESDRLYECVKSYDKQQCSRGEGNDLERMHRGGERKKTRKNPSTRVSPKRRSPGRPV